VLPVVTKSRALSETAEVSELVAKLLGLCAQEPVLAVAVVSETLARQQPGRCVLSEQP
jgi:hypothetical protein